MGTPWERPTGSGWDNFVSAFGNHRVWRSLWTTLLFAAVCVTAEMVLGIALALALEGEVRGMAFFRTLFILPMMIAPIAVGLTWRYLFDAQFGLINAALIALGWSPRPGWPIHTGVHRHRHRRHLAVDAVRLHHDDRRAGQRRQLGASRPRASTARAGGRRRFASSCRW